MRFLSLAVVAIFVLGVAYYWPRQPDVAERRSDAVYAGEKSRATAVAVRSGPKPIMNVEAAYRAIPHDRTVFLLNQARMPRDEARYLVALFTLTDIAVAERVYLQNLLRRGHAVDIAASNYAEILDGLRALPTPSGLLPVENMIHQAIEEQRDYLQQWTQSGNPGFFDSRAGLVQKSHGKLIAAYAALERRYGEESRHNTRAFYDYLCALDFI